MAKQTLKDVKIEVLVGGVVFLILLLLGAFTILLTRENIFKKRYTVTVLFRDISTLSNGDKVVIRGMPVGKVKGLDLKRDGIKVVCSLSEEVPIHEDYRIRIISTSMLGGKALQIEPGTTNMPLVAEGTRLKGTDPTDLMDGASEAVAELRRALQEGKVIENVEQAATSLREITDKINKGEGLIGRLINDSAMADDFKALSGQLKEISGRIERREGTLGKLLSSDDTLYTNLSASVASLKTISERLEKGEGTLGRLLSKDDTVYNDLQASVASLKDIASRLEKGEGTLGKLLSKDDTVYKDLQNAVAALKSTAEKIDKGEGSLGLLINDATVYNDVKATIREVKAAVDDFRETTPVVSFGSLLLGAL